MIDKHSNEIIEFINRRFKLDCNWTNGNCYYFALILADRFKHKNASIYQLDLKFGSNNVYFLGLKS